MDDKPILPHGANRRNSQFTTAGMIRTGQKSSEQAGLPQTVWAKPNSLPARVFATAAVTL
jgi:hypothetical protein